MEKNLLSFLILFCIFSFTDKKSSDLETQTPLSIVVYEGKKYASYDLEIRENARNLKHINRNNDISSVMVAFGTVARFHRDTNYVGDFIEVVGPYKIPRLSKYYCKSCSELHWDNEISSIKLYSNSRERRPGIYGDITRPLKPYPYNNAHY